MTPLEWNEPPLVTTAFPVCDCHDSRSLINSTSSLSDDLFSLDPPEGYRLVNSDEFQMPGMELPGRPAEFQIVGLRDHAWPGHRPRAISG